VIPFQGYRMVIDRHGSMEEWWLAGENRRNAEAENDSSSATASHKLKQTFRVLMLQ